MFTAILLPLLAAPLAGSGPGPAHLPHLPSPLVALPDPGRPLPPGTVALTLDGAALAALAVAAEHGAVVDGVPVAPGVTLSLGLARRHPLAPNATVVAAARGADGAIATRAVNDAEGVLLAGSIPGVAGSHAFLSVGAAGVHGLVQTPAARWIISSGPLGNGGPILAFDPAQVPAELLDGTPWICAADQLQQPSMVPGGGVAEEPPCRQVRIAVDTDAEFLQLFGGDTNAAANYAILLMTASSEIYTEQVNARFGLTYLRLWETPEDPWDQGSTVDQLFQFRDHWEAEMGGVTRDLAHYLSGRGLGGGVAWLPGLCNGYGYGLSANLGGSFPYPLVDKDWGNWDIMVVSHELGHNFGALHTHSHPESPEQCGNGDCSLAGSGTIMSYCHTCPGGMSNITLEFAPVSVSDIVAELAGNPCDFTPAAGNPVAVLDAAWLLAGGSVTVDVLANDQPANCLPVTLDAFDAASAAGGTVTSEPAGLHYAPPSGFSGADSFSYSISDGSASAVATVLVDVVPLLPPTNVSGSLPGLDCAYYALAAPQVLPDFTALTAYANAVVGQVNFPSTGGNFSTSGRADEVGAVYTGWFVAPGDGLYTLFTESDDGSRLLVDGQVVVTNDGLHGMVERAGTIALKAGHHPLRIEFFENQGGAGLIARVQGPGISKSVIPASMLRRGGSVLVGDLNGDGAVNGADLGLLIAQWGTPGPQADLNGDGTVNGADLGLLIAAWTG